MISKSRVAALVAAGAGLVLAISGCTNGGGSPSPTDSNGATGDPLIFGVMASYTASGSNSGPAIEAGFRARFEMENAAGGIDGHPIQVQTADDALDPAKSPAAARTLVEDDNALAVTTSGSGTAAALQPYLEQQGILAFTGGAPTNIIESPTSTFREHNPTYEDLGSRIAQFAIEKLGYTKIGIAYTDDVIGDPFRDGALKVIQDAGLQPAAVVSYSAGATDASSQAAQLKQSGAQIVLLNHVPSVEGLIINAANQIDYHPDYGSTFAASNTSFLDLFGKDLEGKAYFATSFMLPTSDAAAPYREWLAKVDSSIDPNDTDALNGWTQADAMVAVFKKAVEAAGGAVPTREQVLAAATDIQISDDYIIGINWSKTDFTGQDESRIIGIKGGTFYEVDPPAKNPVTVVLPG